MQHAAIWHWYLLLCIYIIFVCVLMSIPFYIFKKSGIDKLKEWSMIPGTVRKELIHQKIVFDVCVCVVLCKLLSGLIL